MAKGSNNLTGRRSSSHNTKPYDANNSFVKKVATKVTDLIPQRLWISKWFNSSQNEDVLEDNENLEEVESEEDIQKPPPLKRPCIRMDVTHPPGTFSIQPRTKSTINKTSVAKQQYSIHNEMSEDFCKPGMAGPSGISHLVSSTPTMQSSIRNVAPQRSELNSLVATTNNGTTNGTDDNSESSESTSGCSSLIPQTNRQEAPSNVSYHSPFSKRKRFNDDKLSFTNHMQSPRSLFLDNNNRDTLSSRRPSFNASIMTNTPDRASPLASPFYSGNITFGGANAAGLYKQGRNLFNSSNEIQLKVPKRTSVEVKPSNTAGIDSSGMSQTAKKILEALEHFSSPITDAKKIPLKMMNNTSSINKKRTREEMTSTTKVGLRHLTRELTVPTVPDILKLRRRQKLQDTTVAARKIISARSEPPPPQEYHLRTQTNEDLKHHGKTKGTKLEQEDTIEPVNLPNIPLPISSLPNFNFMPSTNTTVVDETSIDKQDTFTFASPIKVTSTTKNLKSINNFTFSSPINADKQSIDKSNDINSSLNKNAIKSNISSNEYIPPVIQNFIWSDSSIAPRLKEKIKNSDGTISSDELKSGSVMDVLCSKSEKSNESKMQLDSDKETTINKINTVSPNINDNIIKTLNSQSNMWECSECLFKNNDSETHCFTCKAIKSNLKDKKISEISTSNNANELKTTVKDHFGLQFKLSSNQWECTSCFLRNKQNDTKCIACNALKPDIKQEIKFVKNKERFEECPKCKSKDFEKTTCSCNTFKSNELKITPQKNTNSATDTTDISANEDNRTNTSTNTFSNIDKLKSSKDTWECPSCMVRNLISIDSCPCCNTAKPSVGITTKNIVSTFPNGFGDKFKKPDGAWNCNTCMIQNEAKITICVACGDSKPGSKKSDNSTSANSSSNLQFNFDMPANSTGFKFGIDKAGQEKTDSTISSNDFKFGENQQNSQTGQFTFGIQKEEKKTSETQKSENNILSTSENAFQTNASNSEKTDIKQNPEKIEKNTTLFSFGIAKSESGTIECNKQSGNVTTATIPSTFTFDTSKTTMVQSDTKEEKQIENTIVEVSKPNTGTIESSNAININTLSSITQSNTQETKSTATFSFGVPSNTIAVTSSTSTIVVSSLPSSTQSSFTFLESKSTTQTSIVPTFGQISTSAPTANLTNTFTFGDSKTREGSSITKTFGTLPSAPSGNTLFSNISNSPSLFNNDTKTTTFGQTSTEDNKQPAFGATSTNKSSTFAMPENKVPIFGNTENKPIFGSPDTKMPVFGNTDNKVTSLFNPPLQPSTATPIPFGGPSATPTLFRSSVTPVFGNNTTSTFTTESTPSIFGSTSKPSETGTSNSNIFTFGTSPPQAVAKSGTGFNFSANTNPGESTQKPLFTFGSHTSTPQSNNLFGNTFNNPTSTNAGFTFNAPKPEATAFAQSAATTPTIFGTPQPGVQNQASSSFSSTPSNTGFNFGTTTPAVTSSGGFNFGVVAPASTPSAGFNFNPPSNTPTFDPNTPPSFNFTGGNAPPTFNATPTQTQRKIKKAFRRMR